MLGRWVILPINPGNQCILLKIVGFLLTVSPMDPSTQHIVLKIIRFQNATGRDPGPNTPMCADGAALGWEATNDPIVSARSYVAHCGAQWQNVQNFVQKLCHFFTLLKLRRYGYFQTSSSCLIATEFWNLSINESTPWWTPLWEQIYQNF